MNFYVVVEGELASKRIYQKWIKYVNPKLKSVDSLDKIKDNNFFIYAGYGNPYYFNCIEDAIDDVNERSNIDRLVISVDSEDMSFIDKFNEIDFFISKRKCRAEVCIVIQHFCIETWALGNQKIISRNPQNEKLKEFLKVFDVIYNDPEAMPRYSNLNRAQFAYQYLRAAVNEKYRNLSYSKTEPKILLNQKYFNNVKLRLTNHSHINSFKYFINAFSERN